MGIQAPKDEVEEQIVKAEKKTLANRGKLSFMSTQMANTATDMQHLCWCRGKIGGLQKNCGSKYQMRNKTAMFVVSAYTRYS